MLLLVAMHGPHHVAQRYYTRAIFPFIAVDKVMLFPWRSGKVKSIKAPPILIVSKLLMRSLAVLL